MYAPHPLSPRRSQGEQTALHLAAELDNVECVQLLLTHGASVGMQDGQRRDSVGGSRERGKRGGVGWPASTLRRRRRFAAGWMASFKAAGHGQHGVGVGNGGRCCRPERGRGRDDRFGFVSWEFFGSSGEGVRLRGELDGKARIKRNNICAATERSHHGMAGGRFVDARVRWYDGHSLWMPSRGSTGQSAVRRHLEHLECSR